MINYKKNICIYWTMNKIVVYIHVSCWLNTYKYKYNRCVSINIIVSLIVRIIIRLSIVTCLITMTIIRIHIIITIIINIIIRIMTYIMMYYKIKSIIKKEDGWRCDAVYFSGIYLFQATIESLVVLYSLYLTKSILNYVRNFENF